MGSARSGKARWLQCPSLLPFRYQKTDIYENIHEHQTAKEVASVERHADCL